MKQTSFMRQLNAYFESYLPEIRSCSPHTISAYVDSFTLLFRFFQEKRSLAHYLISYKHLTSTTLDEFMLWLGTERHYTESSKRHRLSAISAFLKYASRRDMSALNAFTNVSNLHISNTKRSDFPYFTVEEVTLLLRLPSPQKRLGSRDMVLLSLLYDSAARAQEICDVCVCDIRFGTPTKVKLHGKENKVREVPVSDEMSNLLRYHLKTKGSDVQKHREKPLFSSQTNEKMTPACIRSITDKYVKLAQKTYPELFYEPKYSPHSWRHSKAVHMAEAGTPLIYIRDFLGHATVQSTEIYARVGQAVVTKALTERKIPRPVPNADIPERPALQLPSFLKR